MPLDSFGATLKHYRKTRDLTQAELAQLVGCAAESIRKMEANKQRPSKPFAQRLADFLALAPDERLEFLQLARSRPDTEEPSTPEQAVEALFSSLHDLPIRFHSLVGRRAAIDAIS